jgi:Ca2+-transporting ATPase
MLTLPLQVMTAPAVLVRHRRRARRLRFRVPGLTGRPDLAAEVEREVDRMPGVERACASAASGRLLVEYSRHGRFLSRLRVSNGDRRPVAVSARQAQPEEAWHALPVSDVLRLLDSGMHGLSEAEARRRLERYGANAAEEPRERGRLETLLAQVANLPAALLLGSSAISSVLGDWFDAGAILAVLGLDAGIGYGIERSNEDLLASWRRLEAGEAHVLRDGALRRVPAMTLVPGDVILLRSGDVVPADARVIDPHRLSCNEAALTGES